MMVFEKGKFNKVADCIANCEAFGNGITLSNAFDKLSGMCGNAILGMSLIERLFNEMMTAKEEGQKFDTGKIVEYDYTLCAYAKKLVTITNRIVNSKSIVPTNENGIFGGYAKQFYELKSRMMEIAARWDIEELINVYEFDTPPDQRAYNRRKPLLETCIFFANRMAATKMGVRFSDGIMPKRIIFAVQPNAGKSFLVNMYTLLSTIHHFIYLKTSGTLRMSNNAGNAEGFANQIKAMLENPKISSVFPELKKYFKAAKPKILERTVSDEWKLVDLDPKIRASHFARGREAAINSIRIFVLLAIDDLSDGVEQMNNDTAHQEMSTKYIIDMDSRKDVENLPEFIAGTMFNEFDVPNTLIKKLEDAGDLVEDANFECTRHTKDYSTVVIAMDCYDSKGTSRAPLLISTEKLRDKQNDLKPYEFDLVYRQMRASREPRAFDYGNLLLYKELPKNLSETSIAILDPTRRSGRDYFALPVFRYNPDNDKYYFVDCIYEQKSLGKVYDPKNEFLKKVVDFLVKNKVTRFIIENNTSNTLGLVFDEQLKARGYTGCKIEEKYTTKVGSSSSKMQRIVDQEATITSNIYFPDKNVFPVRHPMSLFMLNFTSTDTKMEVSSKDRHDDAPDSIAMFSKHCLYNRSTRLSKIKSIDTRLWGRR